MQSFMLSSKYAYFLLRIVTIKAHLAGRGRSASTAEAEAAPDRI